MVPSLSRHSHSPPRSRSPSGRSSAPSRWGRPAAAAAGAAPRQPASAGILQRRPGVTGGTSPQGHRRYGDITAVRYTAATGMLPPHGCCHYGDMATMKDTTVIGDTAAMGGTPMVTGDTATKGGYHCYGDAAIMGTSPWGTPLSWGTLPLRGTPPQSLGMLPQRGCCCPGEATTMGMLPPQGHHHHGGWHCHGDAATMGDTTTPGTLPPQSHYHPGEAATTGTGPPWDATLLILLGPLEEGELAGVVDDSELAEEGVDDLAGAGVREDVEVFDGPLGQVEGRAALHPLGTQPRPPCLQGGDPLGGRH